MKIIVDRARCEGHGMCEALAPNLFRVGDDGVVEPADLVGEGDRDLVRLAVDSCPVEALRSM
ncbi:ferredoxin [Nocardia tenerifensis]|uniref:Ferredoxin n=1 Tax=Nocardia tenerifensis TaxID=228006 RepID=A0A318JVR2_9NOCA|nr:ferredoxin [Nocardia tenerifensis]PXX57471.1 ferredoxin [Nocardia tenerifensis]